MIFYFYEPWLSFINLQRITPRITVNEAKPASFPPPCSVDASPVCSGLGVLVSTCASGWEISPQMFVEHLWLHSTPNSSPKVPQKLAVHPFCVPSKHHHFISFLGAQCWHSSIKKVHDDVPAYFAKNYHPNIPIQHHPEMPL